MNGLEGKRILITRSEEDGGAWATALAERGAVAIALPCIGTEWLESTDVRESLAAGLRDADWLVLTSRRGAEAVAALLGAGSPDAVTRRFEDGPKIAVVGPATADAARECLGRADFIGTGGTAASLAETLVAEAARDRAQRFVLALAENAGRVLEDTLAGAGFNVHRVDVYRTRARPKPDRQRTYSQLGCDVVWLASPSAAAGFVNQVEMDTAPVIVTIGPSTSAAARRLGLEIGAEAAEPSLDALMEATQCLN